LYRGAQFLNRDSKENNMQHNNTDTEMFADDAVFFTPKKKIPKARKWREIEEMKAQQKLAKELSEIDLGVDFPLNKWAWE
jgi:hypothetical protein